MALSSSANHWRSSRWLCHASPLFFLLPPFPLQGPALYPILLLPAFSSSGFRGFSELWDKEVQTCLTFLHPPLCRNWQFSPPSVGACHSCWPILWNGVCSSVSLEISRHLGEFWKAKSASQEREMFSAELCGQRARVHLADRFLSAALQCQAACLWGRGSDLWVHVVALAEHLSAHSLLLKWLPLKLGSEEGLSSSVAAC